MKPLDVWAVRLVAAAILIASISLLIGTGAYAYREIVTTNTSLKQAPTQTPTQRR